MPILSLSFNFFFSGGVPRKHRTLKALAARLEPIERRRLSAVVAWTAADAPSWRRLSQWGTLAPGAHDAALAPAGKPKNVQAHETGTISVSRRLLLWLRQSIGLQSFTWHDR